MLSPSEVGARYEQIRKQNEADFEKLVREYLPDRPFDDAFSPFYRFGGRPISEEEAGQLRTELGTRAYELVPTILKRWQRHDKLRGVNHRHWKDQTNRFIAARLKIAIARLNGVIETHNRNLQPTVEPAKTHPCNEPKKADKTKGSKRPKLRAERSPKQVALIAALTKHHRYADGGCLNLEPIGNNELARLAKVGKRTASAFFKKEFKGHSNYKVTCTDARRLAAALRLLNGEFAPHLLIGNKLLEKTHQADDGDNDE